MRIKIDSNSTDPAGSDDIISAGGSMTDLMLTIHPGISLSTIINSMGRTAGRGRQTQSNARQNGGASPYHPRAQKKESALLRVA